MRKLIARSFAFYRGKANSEHENVSSSGQLFSLSLLYYYVYVFLFFFFFPPLFCCSIATILRKPSLGLEEGRNAGGELISCEQGHRYAVHFVTRCAGPLRFLLLQNGLSRYDEWQVHRPCRKMKIRLSFAGNRAHGKRESNTRRTPTFRSFLRSEAFRFEDKCPLLCAFDGSSPSRFEVKEWKLSVNCL